MDLAEQMIRAIARQAEAERERRAKVIHAEGEYMAAEKLGMAAEVIQKQPAALQLRYLQTLVEIGQEKNTTIVFPLPLDILTWLAGTGVLAIPAFGPLVEAGPILGALAGAAAVGTVAGFVGAMIGMRVPEYEAKRYDGRIRKGGILLSVHCDDSDWTKRAKRILADTGAVDTASTSPAIRRSKRPPRKPLAPVTITLTESI